MCESNIKPESDSDGDSDGDSVSPVVVTETVGVLVAGA